LVLREKDNCSDKKKKPNKQNVGQVQCLQPIILATWEAEIGRIIVGGQPRQKVNETPSQLGTVVHTCHPSHIGKHK
jgi:hypothetical protein